MEILLKWITTYSLPVVLLLLLGAALVFVLQKATEKAIATQFDRYAKEVTLQLERRSRFEEKILLDQYLAVTEIFSKLDRIATDLNRHRHGNQTSGLIVEREVVPLTQVFNELTAKRYLLGPVFHPLLRRIAELELRLANAVLGGSQPDPAEAAWEELAADYLNLIDEFHTTAVRYFGIDRIGWKAEQS